MRKVYKDILKEVQKGNAVVMYLSYPYRQDYAELYKIRIITPNDCSYLQVTGNENNYFRVSCFSQYNFLKGFDPAKTLRFANNWDQTAEIFHWEVLK